MNLFLDSSVVLAACLSRTGASRLIFESAHAQGWRLVVSPWVLREVRVNLVGMENTALTEWVGLRSLLAVESDELVFDWPLHFTVAKDKPVLLAALASAEVLLTLDRRDFRDLLDTSVYGMRVLTPGSFLVGERAAGRF